MDFTAAYCPTRRDLEERGWFLTSRLSALTGHLLQLVGRDHREFLEVREACHAAREAITESHRGLKEHRRHHGC